MKKKIVISILCFTMALSATACGKATANNTETNTTDISTDESKEIEVAVPKDEEQGTESTLTWVELASLDTYPEMRSAIDTAVGVYCKIKVPKVAKQKWTFLHVHFGHNCKALYHDSMERCSA